MVLLSLGFTIAATAVYTHGYAQLDPATRSEFHTDTIGLILQPAAEFAQLAVCVLGVLSLIPGSAGRHLAGALPSGTSVMTGSGHNAGNVYSPAQGLLILVGWVAVTGAAALWSIKKRDV